MADLTVITLTKDEEQNIERCIRSVSGFAARHIVIDSGSMDDTAVLARSLGAEVYVHPFENYARQFNWGIDNLNLTTKWLLRLDADECFTPALCEKLERLLAAHADDDVNGFMMEANFFFLGRHIRHGGPKKRKVMIVRVGHGRIEDRRMDEHTLVDSGRVLELTDRFDHYDFKNIDAFVSKLNWYATREMQDYFEHLQGISTSASALGDNAISSTRKKKFGFYYRLPLFLRPFLLFIYNYFFRLGFLDGKEGFIYHWLYQRFYRTLVDAKIYEQLKNPRPFEATGALGESRLGDSVPQDPLPKGQ